MLLWKITCETTIILQMMVRKTSWADLFLENEADIFSRCKWDLHSLALAGREGPSVPFCPQLERPQQCFPPSLSLSEQCKGTKSHEQIHGYPCLAFRGWHFLMATTTLKRIQLLGCPSLNEPSGGSWILTKKVKNPVRHGLIFMPMMTVAVYFLNKCLIYIATGWVHSRKQTTGNLSDSQEGRIVNMGLHYSKKKKKEKKKKVVRS